MAKLVSLRLYRGRNEKAAEDRPLDRATQLTIDGWPDI